MIPDLILQNGRITTLDPQKPEARELVVAGGRIVGVDNADQRPGSSIWADAGSSPV